MKCIYDIEPDNCIRTDCRYYSTLQSKCSYHNIMAALRRDRAPVGNPTGLNAVLMAEQNQLTHIGEV